MPKIQNDLWFRTDIVFCKDLQPVTYFGVPCQLRFKSCQLYTSYIPPKLSVYTSMPLNLLIMSIEVQIFQTLFVRKLLSMVEQFLYLLLILIYLIHSHLHKFALYIFGHKPSTPKGQRPTARRYQTILIASIGNPKQKQIQSYQHCSIWNP